MSIIIPSALLTFWALLFHIFLTSPQKGKRAGDTFANGNGELLIVPTFPKPLVHFLSNFCAFFFSFFCLGGYWRLSPFTWNNAQHLEERERVMWDKMELTVWRTCHGGENLVLEIIHGARAQYIHKQQKRTRSSRHTHDERTLALWCCVSPGRRLADHWAKDSDPSAGYILALEIVTDVISRAADWSAHANQDVSFGLFHFAYWLPAGLVSSPTTSPPTYVPYSPERTQRTPFPPTVPSTHTHTCTATHVRSPCQMPNVRAFFPIFFHVFPYYSRPWIIITLVVNLFNSTCLARPSSTRH